MTYREKFASELNAQDYDLGEYGQNSYSSVLWEVEKSQLHKLVEEFRRSHDRIDYLDFATGTGRIINFMRGRVDSLTGIEVSPSMAELARQRVEDANIICSDITRQDDIIESKYDLITAFRFVLNAEPELRVQALKALAKRLKDDSSWLIFNNHGNPWSHKLIMWPVHSLKKSRLQVQHEGNYLLYKEILRDTEQAGLRITDVMGCGLLSSKITKFMSFDRAVSVERSLARSKIMARFGVNKMYVAQLA